MDTIGLLSVIIFILAALYIKLKKKYTYWERKGLPYLQPEFFFGNIKNMIIGRLGFVEQYQQLYNEMKSRGWKHGGFYSFFNPAYMVTDTELLKHILQIDFNHFVNHGLYFDEKADPLSGHLFNLKDSKWKNIRTKITPAFSSGRIKSMIHTVLENSNRLKYLLTDHAVTQEAVNIKEITDRFATDNIGLCGFGIDVNSLKNPNNKFRQICNILFDETVIGVLKQICSSIIPEPILLKIGLKLTKNDVESFFMSTFTDLMDYREKNNIDRDDLMQRLLILRRQGEIKEEFSLTANEVIAQCLIFFVGGFETASITIMFSLYELTENQEYQQKLREEILSVLKKHDDEITYEAIKEMTYLDKIIHEILRKYPPITGTIRQCSQAYTVPGTNVTLERGTMVQVPIFSFHRDPEYFPDPDVFDPERFSEENKTNWPEFAYIPFGRGPRACPGSKFGLLQVKIGLVTIIKNFRVTLNKKTHLPVKLSTNTVRLGIEGGLWLNVSRIK